LPPLRFGTRVQYHSERFLGGLEVTRYDSQTRVAAFEQPTAGYTIVNADFRWRLAVGGKELEWFLNASNLGDADARKHTSFVKHLAPLPGRNYAVGIRSRF
jgi:iron complex outermembrane recepter protein